MRKLKIFKKKRKTRKTSRKKENQNNFPGKKLSPVMLGIIGGFGLLMVITCYKLFGDIIAILMAMLYIIIMFFTQVLDNSPKKSTIRKVVKISFTSGIVLGIVGVISLVGFLFYVASTAPEFNITNLTMKEMTLIFDKNGKQIAELGTEKRELIKYEDLPEVLIDALIATEDSRFFQHNGFDAPRFIKASIGQIIGGSEAGGASTLTMQVSKNNFTSIEAGGFKGIVRKFTDIYISMFKLERAYTKQEIVEFYLNQPFFGNNSHGIEQASQTYFEKSVAGLNVAEASLLVGLLQAPSAYEPFNNPENATERRSMVLNLMVRHGYITKEQADIAKAIPVEDLITDKSNLIISEYQSYIDSVVNEVEKKLGVNPYIVPLKIYTNMDSKKQDEVNKIMSGETYKWPNSKVQGGIAAIESGSGKILALGGNRKVETERGYNYATDIKRQIGSTSKPLFDYAPGMEYNNWSTYTLFKDEKYTYSNGVPISNFDYSYKGVMTLRESLRQSRNITALKAFQQVENAKIVSFVRSLGIEPEVDDVGTIHEAHAIGAFNGSNPLEMAAAYAAFSNGGYYYEPYTVNKVEFRDSKETIKFESEKKKVMSDSTAFMISNILMGVASDIGVAPLVKGNVAVKTGSTNYDGATAKEYGFPSDATPDGWIVGFTPDIAMAMWTGFTKNEKGVYLTNNQMVTHRNGLYRAASKAVFNQDGTTFKKPSSVVLVEVEMGSNPAALPSDATPTKMKVKEYFKKGTEPTEVSNRYRKLPDVSNLNLSYTGGSINLSWDIVAEPTDINKEEYGEFGYKIYKDGVLLGFTTVNAYNYPTTSQYGVYRVTSAYSKLNNNESAGIIYEYLSNISFRFNETENVTLHVGDSLTLMSKPISIFEDLIDVTSTSQVTIFVIDENANTTLYSVVANTNIPSTIINNIINAINTSVPGNYKITYQTVYKGEISKLFTKKIKISS